MKPKKFGGSGLDKEVYDWILFNLQPGQTVLEFGSGHTSTRYLSMEYRMFSIEHDERYVGLYKKSTYIHAPLVIVDLPDGGQTRWYDPKILMPFLRGAQYDLILMDGPVNAKHRRGFLTVLEYIKPPAPIVFHDTDRPIEAALTQEVACSLKRDLIMYPDYPFMRVVL